MKLTIFGNDYFMEDLHKVVKTNNIHTTCLLMGKYNM